MPWLEKYRPILMKDIVGNEETISRLKVIGKHGNMPKNSKLIFDNLQENHKQHLYMLKIWTNV